MAIVKTTVSHQLISPSASIVQRSGIIRLGGFVGGQWRDIEGMTADGQIISWEPANADGAGSWSVALIPNADVVSPANTLYRYMPAQGQAVVFEVGSTASALKDLVVSDPAQWPGLAPTVKGDAATVDVDPVAVTGAAGSAVAVANTGTTSAARFQFTIPRGDPGAAATITPGMTTTGAPGSAAAVTNSGTTSAAVFDFTIPAGAAATITPGTTTTGAPGTSAAVSNSGTPSAAVFDFTIPQGANGVSVGDTAPTDTSLLWVDTSDPGPAVPIALDDLTDVDTAGVADKNVLTFDVASSSWKPAAPSGGGSSAWEYWGQGRPDVAGTLDAGGTAWVAAASSGAVFHSTDGPQGAQQWVKTAAGWIVVVGDTGWRTVTLTGGAAGTAKIRRYGGLIAWDVQSFTGSPGTVATVPAGFESVSFGTGPKGNSAYSSGTELRIQSTLTGGGGFQILAVTTAAVTWPSTLPGTPA